MARGDNTTNKITGTGQLLPATAARGEVPARVPPTPQARAGARIDVPEAKAWLTAAEAAEEQLPELPNSKRHINRLVGQLNIPTRKRIGKGGGREFHWSMLPAAARHEYLKRHGVETIDNPREENSKTRAARRGAL